MSTGSAPSGGGVVIARAGVVVVLAVPCIQWEEQLAGLCGCTTLWCWW